MHGIDNKTSFQRRIYIFLHETGSTLKPITIER